MSIALAQAAVLGNSAAATLVLTINSVGLGNLLTLIVSWSDSSSNSPAAVPTDTNGTWVAGENPAGVLRGTRYTGTSIFYCKNAASGTHAVTFTNPGSTGRTQWGSLCEWSGCDATAPLDAATPNTANAANSSAQALTVTTAGAVSAATELLLAGISVDTTIGVANMALVTPAGFTQLQANQNDNADIGVQHSYRIGTGLSGSQSAAWTWTDASANAYFLGSIATFIASAGPTDWLLYRKPAPNTLLRM